MWGINAAQSEYIVVGDADNTYDFSDLDSLLSKLEAGYDLVVGNRLKGEIESGAMPFLHHYLGTPLITSLGNVLFNTGIGDFNGGLRAIRKSSYSQLQLSATGMSSASEMIIKAKLAHLKLAEVTVNYYRSVKGRRANLRTWQDGFEHIKLIMTLWFKSLYLP